MYQNFTDYMNEGLMVQGIVLSVIFISILLAGRFALRKFIKGKREILDKDQRRWLNSINNTTSVLVLLTLIFIWAPQIQTFALSLTAVAVAVVITTKELLMCLTGGFLRATTKPFGIGDWITVDNLTGEVMRVTALTTMIEEIDTTNKAYYFTGRTVQIPNSRFLSQNVENANFIRSYVYYETVIVVKNLDLDPSVLMDALQEVTETHYAPYRVEATKFNKKVEKKVAVDFDDPDPQFFLRAKEENHLVFTARMFIPTKTAAKVSALITQDFSKIVHDMKQAYKIAEAKREKTERDDDSV